MDEASPRFRKDLEASPTETDGVACVDVSDPKSGTNFRFYDFEYQLALQFNGQPLGDVTAWASAAYGVDLTVDGINEFAGRLAELGFLEAASGAPAAGDATPATGTKVPDLDSAEDEWMSAEGAKTATFVPDPAMLDSPSELTPVAPELPTMDDEGSEPTPAIDVTTGDTTPIPEPVKQTPTAPNEAPPPRLFDIPLPAAAKAPPTAAKAASSRNDVPTPLSLPGVKVPAPPPLTPAKPGPSWATDLEGTLRAPGEPAGLTPPPVAAAKDGAGLADTKTPPPLSLLKTPAAAAPPPPSAAPAPPGLPERRQPPTPDAVQMAAFSPEGAAAAAKPKPRTGRIIGVVILLLVMAGLAYVAWTREQSRAPQAVRVRVMSPKPAAVYRWFSGRGTVTDHEGRTLAFEQAGTLAELLPPGTAFAAGDILGRLRGAQPIEALLARHRARLTFYQQMRDSMRAANNQPELRQAEIKLAEKQRLIDEANAALAKLVVRASEPGEVVETLAKVGTPVKAGAPLLKVKGRVLHGEFELDASEIASAGKLGFCRVEVIGLGPRASNAEAPAAAGTAADVGSPDAQAVPRFVDCTIVKGAAGETKLRVSLPDNLGLVPGQPLRLARQRYDAVFPVPAGAVGGSADRRSIWIAGAGGKAERRDVLVADASDDVLVSDGLHVGEDVIVDAPADLREGASIVADR
jgi:multidrug efflux pump subunit AcrA (membrane-fusion protein)